jgi:hypothetical protein
MIIDWVIVLMDIAVCILLHGSVFLHDDNDLSCISFASRGSD